MRPEFCQVNNVKEISQSIINTLDIDKRIDHKQDPKLDYQPLFKKLACT